MRDGVVSFIVPAYNATSSLAATVASIREAAAGFEHEIVICNDASLDATLDLARTLGDVVTSRACQSGAARARNDAVEHARGDVFFFVDSDVTVTPEAVATLLDHLDEGADAAFGAYTALPPPEVRNSPTMFKNLLHHFTHYQGGGVVTTFWSGFSVIRRDAFFEVRGFDPRVTWSADVEDIHLGYRLAKAGKTIVLDPHAQVMHHKRYTLQKMVVSDVIHRAIPWTKAMLELRTFTICLNLKSASIASSLVLYGGLASALAIPLAPVAGAAGVAGLALTWTVLNREIIGYARIHWSVTGAMRVAAYLSLMNFYAPLGAAVGVILHLLRGPHHSVRNTLSLGPLREVKPVEVTVAVVLGKAKGFETLAALPAPEPWWELVVVGQRRPTNLPDHATFVQAEEGQGPNAQSQLALDRARGQVIALLGARDVPTPDWLEHVRTAAERGDLAVGGAFDHDRRGARERAQCVLWHWRWRPEHPAMWMQDHPPTNAAYRVDAVRRLGGFDGASGERVGVFRRLSAYGARPVRFDPGMVVRQATDIGPHPLRDTGRFAAATSAAMVRYYDYGLPVRLAFVATTPVHATLHLARLVLQARREGTADRTFFAALPKIVGGTLLHEAGAAVGLLRSSRPAEEITFADFNRGDGEPVARLA